MADVDTGGGEGRGRKGSGPKTKKKSTRIDMTAMVDVAFLLLTFFVLTATMTNSNLLELTMPPKAETEEQKEESRQKILEDKILTMILDEEDVIKYYVGITEPDVQETNYSPEGLRKVLLEHINKGEKIGAPLCKNVNNAKGCWDPIFVIKPREKSRYENLVVVLDELAITKAPKYAIDKFTPADSTLLVQDELEESGAEVVE